MKKQRIEPLSLTDLPAELLCLIVRFASSPEIPCDRKLDNVRDNVRYNYHPCHRHIGRVLELNRSIRGAILRCAALLRIEQQFDQSSRLHRLTSSVKGVCVCVLATISFVPPPPP